MFKIIQKSCLALALMFGVGANADVTVGKLKDGIRHVNAAQAGQVVQQYPDVVVLDIRTPKEFNDAHIAGALNIDYYASDYKQNLAKLDKDTTYLLHCRSGVRSGRSLKLFRELGFKNVIHLDGGIKAWRSGGLPLNE
ncbi:rhodanese-like domain-containing protein [bacterium SCSIO 12696]|nr:rhodanese-like domain-containing protein [bacterium SCSIO 12696]